MSSLEQMLENLQWIVKDMRTMAVTKRRKNVREIRRSGIEFFGRSFRRDGSMG